jgi:hypothetical protein
MFNTIGAMARHDREFLLGFLTGLFIALGGYYVFLGVLAFGYTIYARSKENAIKH